MRQAPSRALQSWRRHLGQKSSKSCEPFERRRSDVRSNNALERPRIAASAIVLDMDGVLLRTNDAKYRAMLGLFERHPEKTPAISKFILSKGGVPRAEKLKYILESIVGIVASEAMVDEYLVEY